HVGLVITLMFLVFSSRRRHTICYRDWSSDVCSSDLAGGLPDGVTFEQFVAQVAGHVRPALQSSSFGPDVSDEGIKSAALSFDERSEERRVGKERGGRSERRASETRGVGAGAELRAAV